MRKQIPSCSKCKACQTHVDAVYGVTPRCARNAALYEAIQFEVRMHTEVSAKWLCTNADAVNISKETIAEEIVWSDENDFTVNDTDISESFEAQLLADISGHIEDENEETVILQDPLEAATFDYIESLGATKFTDPDSRWVRFDTIVKGISERIAVGCPYFEQSDPCEEVGILDRTAGWYPDAEEPTGPNPDTLVHHLTTEVMSRFVKDMRNCNAKDKLTASCRLTFDRWESHYHKVEFSVPRDVKSEVWRLAAVKLLLASEEAYRQAVA